MKRFILVISILLLTVFVNAKEFIIPSFDLNYSEVINELKENYTVNYNQKRSAYTVYDIPLYYCGQKVSQVIILPGDKESEYSYILFMEDMTTNEWLYCSLKTISQLKFFDIIEGKVDTLACKQFNGYNCAVRFKELETQEKEIIKTIAINKLMK